MKMYIKTLAALILSVAILSPLHAQQSYTMASGGELKVSGTSTFHDWTMKSTAGTGKAIIALDNNQLRSVSSLQVTLKAETLKSGKSGMDDKAYEALKTEECPNIIFVLKEIKNISQQGANASFSATGDLTIAGVKRSVTMSCTGRISDDRIQFEGKTSFKLSDFNVEPPTAMLGTIKTGNDVTVSFSAAFQELNSTSK